MWPFSKKRNFEKERAGKNYDKGAELADEIIGRARRKLLSECFVDSDLAAFVAKQGPRLHHTFELQFLWGFFHEFIKTEDFPTAGHDRIKLHLMHRLMLGQGRAPLTANAEVNAVEDLLNQRDPVCVATAELGKKSFSSPSDDAMVIICRSMLRRMSR